jgi:hypothetical protein
MAPKGNVRQPVRQNDARVKGNDEIAPLGVLEAVGLSAHNGGVARLAGFMPG